jgi:hypothetical protein
MTEPCGFRPFPGNGAYDHWTCQRSRFHLGHHRYRNYTVGRIPRFWLLRRSDLEARDVWAGPGYWWRQAVYPVRYRPPAGSATPTQENDDG